MTERFDVVVVGARVAGASTALLLARAGARVLVVDRARRGTDTVSTHALMRAGVAQLSRWGVLPAVRQAGTPPVPTTQFHYPDDTVTVTLRPSAGVDALFAPRRTVLDRVLIDHAEEAGTQVRDRTALVGLLTEGRRVTGVRLRGPDGSVGTASARLVVGADGLRSDVASGVAAPIRRIGHHTGAVLYGYRSGLPTQGYEWAYGPATAAGMIPTNDGLTCVFVSTSPERLRSIRSLAGTAEAAHEQLFAVAAPGHVTRLAESEPAGPLHGWSGVTGFVRRSFGPGWALVGDAGYFKDPITAHGMTDALRDADLLARAILELLAGHRPELEALAGYQRQRDRLSAPLFHITERIAAYDWSMSEIRGLLRGAASAMADEVEFLEALHGDSIAAGPAVNASVAW